MRSIINKIKSYGLVNLFYRIVRRGAFFVWGRRVSYLIYKKIVGKVKKRINGFKMVLDLRSDEGISRELFAYGKREHLSTNFLMNSGVLQNGDVVLDVGANIGYYALIESKLVGKKGFVYAIEPVLKNFKLLNENIQLNNITNIKTYHMAAGEKNGRAKINIHQKGNWSSMLRREMGGYTGTEEVNMVKVDDFIEELPELPSLIRMDVEGYEYAILEGMKNVLKSKPPLLIEFHPQILTREQKESIRNLLLPNYEKAIIINDVNPQFLNHQGQIRPALVFLDEKIGQRSVDDSKTGIEWVSIDDVCRDLLSSREAFHAFIY